MPWEADAPGLGFSAAKPWLPVAKPHRALAMDQQTGDSASLLAFYRRFLAWRREHAALRVGSLSLWQEHPQVLSFVREHGGERLLCSFNFSAEPAELSLPEGVRLAGSVGETAADGAPPQPSGLSGALVNAGQIQFQPWGGLILALT
jgi:alpha-glucosidase